MSDAFFTNPRPFTKRKREDGPNASASRSGTSGRGGGRDFNNRGSSSRGGTRGGSSRGASTRGGSRGGVTNGTRGGRGSATSRGGGTDRKGKRRADDDEELDKVGENAMNGGFDSDSDDADQQDDNEEEDQSESEDETETPAQKRLRLSQMYLKSLEKEVRLGKHMLTKPS
jgi:ribosomal RNA-processing protein 9